MLFPLIETYKDVVLFAAMPTNKASIQWTGCFLSGLLATLSLAELKSQTWLGYNWLWETQRSFQFHYLFLFPYSAVNQKHKNVKLSSI